MPIPQTCLPISHRSPLVPVPNPVFGGCDWPVECPPEPYVEGCDCGCPRDPSLLFGPDSVSQFSPDFIVTRPVTLIAIGMPCDAFASVEHGISVCGCYVYDDWYQCGKVVRLSRTTNQITITQPGRYRLKLFNANPTKIYVKKTPGIAGAGVRV